MNFLFVDIDGKPITEEQFLLELLIAIGDLMADGFEKAIS
jgi:hypothetical protein